MTEPIRQSVVVDCPIEDAFELFTERISEWWPDNEPESFVIEPWVGGRVFERSRSGEEREWGSVLAWEPPVRIEFTWRPGLSGDCRQTVDVEFQVVADGTRVTLVHTGWQLAGVQACARCFSAFVSEHVLVAA